MRPPKSSEVAREMGFPGLVKNIENPRKEMEEHYYNPSSSKFSELGLQPHFMTKNTIAEMFETLLPFKDYIDEDKIRPRVVWNDKLGKKR